MIRRKEVREMSGEEYCRILFKLKENPLVNNGLEIFRAARTCDTAIEMYEKVGLSECTVNSRLNKLLNLIKAYESEIITLESPIENWTKDNSLKIRKLYFLCNSMQGIVNYVEESKHMPNNTTWKALEKMCKDYTEAAVWSGRDKLYVDEEVEEIKRRIKAVCNWL